MEVKKGNLEIIQGKEWFANLVITPYKHISVSFLIVENVSKSYWNIN